MTKEELAIVRKYKEWRKTGGPPYLTDDELLFMLDHFDKLHESTGPLTEYRIASRAAAMDWNSLWSIACARHLKP